MRMALWTGAITLQSDGTPRRSPCFAWDGLAQLAACLDPAGAPSGPVNIGNPDDELSIAELARRCAEVAGLSPELVRTAPPGSAQGLLRCAPDIDRVRVRARVRLPPLTSLPDGLSLLRDWVAWSRTDA